MNEELVRAVARAICCSNHCRQPTECKCMQYKDEAVHDLTAIEQAGYAVVPREPTEAMLMVGRDLIGADLAPSEVVNEQITKLYSAMLAAAERN